jgi:hypothetical protein
MAVGILAFGSIVNEPGLEIEAARAFSIERVSTPFMVEFARTSRTRDGAPTLVPVGTGGASVSGTLLVLKDSVSEDVAFDLLYRREAGRVNERITYRQSGAKWIGMVRDFAGVDVCLYTALEANIMPVRTERLVELAIFSAAALSGGERRDGISYLEDQKTRGVWTPLMSGYEEGILVRTGTRSLQAAWAEVRVNPSKYKRRG